MGKKTKIITFRLNEELYKKCIDVAIKESQNSGKIVQISKIIRDAIKEYVK